MAVSDPTSWFANLKIPHKLLMISLSFLLPIGIMLYLIIQSVSGYIKFATFEQYGNNYQRPLEGLLHYIPQHQRLVSRYAKGDKLIVGPILDLEAGIDKIMANLEMIDDKVGQQLQFTDEGLSKRNRSHFRVENLKAEWEDIKKNYLSLTTEASYQKHEHLVTDILTMISHCGDTSNLILDPDLDSYYVMDSTLLILPQTQNRLMKVIEYGEEAFEDGAFSSEERRQLLVYASHLEESDLNHVVSDAAKYLNEDQNFYGVSPSLQSNIPPALEAYREATRHFIDEIIKMVNVRTTDLLPEEFISKGFKAREESFRLWNIAVDELEILLIKRIAYYEHSRFLTLIWALLSLMVSVLLVFFITKKILNPLRELMIAIERVSKGDLTWQVNVKSQTHDEIAELSRTFNIMINNLKKVTVSRDELNEALISTERAEKEIRLIQTIGIEIYKAKDFHSALNIVLKKICETIEGVWAEAWVPSSSGFSMEFFLAWSDNLELLRLVQSESKPIKFNLGEGLPGRIKNSLESLWIEDVTLDKNFLRIDLAKNVGVKAAFGVPLVDDKEVIAVIAFFFKESLPKNEQLVRFVLTIINQLGEIVKRKQVEDNLGSVQTQLLQSEKLASIGQLAAGVAHEINNPVGFISNNMEVLQEYVGNYTKILRVIEQIKIQMDSGDMEKVKATIIELKKLEEDINLDYMMSDVNKLLEQSSRGLERIRKIVLDLKTFAREDKTEATELIKVEEVIDSILSIVQSEIKYKAELIKEYGNTPLIKGSAQRLGQVFINLLVNASHAIEDRGKIIIKTYQKDQYVCINVTDTGKGIASEDMKKIFDPFFTTKPVGQGTGLGLSVSYEIVKKHGGEIRVESKIGEGTTFMVMLPINNEGRS